MSDKRCPFHHKNDDNFFDETHSLNNKIKRRKKHDQTSNSSQNNADKAQKEYLFHFTVYHNI